MTKTNENHGFTLLELIVTIVVIAIIVTIGIPSFQEMIQRNRLRNAAETLYADMQFAKAESIKKNRRVIVYFDTTKWCYGLDDDNSTACNCDSNCTITDSQKVVSGNEYPNVKLTQTFNTAGTTGTTGFDPIRGIALNNGRATFSIPIGGQNKEVQVRVSTTGRVTICTSPDANKSIINYEACPN